MNKLLFIACLVLGHLTVSVKIVNKPEANANLEQFLQNEKAQRAMRIEAEQERLDEKVERKNEKAEDRHRRAKENKEINIEKRLRAVQLAQEKRDREANNDAVDAEQAELRAEFVQQLANLNAKLDAEYKQEYLNMMMRREMNEQDSQDITDNYKQQIINREIRAKENDADTAKREAQNNQQEMNAEERQAQNAVDAQARADYNAKNDREQAELRSLFEFKLAQQTAELETFYKNALEARMRRKAENNQETKQIDRVYQKQDRRAKVRAEEISDEAEERDNENRKLDKNAKIRAIKNANDRENEENARNENDEKQAAKRAQFEQDLAELNRHLTLMYKERLQEQMERAAEIEAENEEIEADNDRRDYEKKLIYINKKKRIANNETVKNLKPEVAIVKHKKSEDDANAKVTKIASRSVLLTGNALA